MAKSIAWLLLAVAAPAGLWAAEKIYCVSDFGAVGDAATLNTAAIQKAIDTAAADGGGIVEIPAGTFLCGSVFLQQGVGLRLAEKAVLLGSTRIEDYEKRWTRIEGHFEFWRMGLVNALGLDGVNITGSGTLNGNGVPFWRAFWKRRTENPHCTNLEVERPRLVFLNGCTHVRIAGVHCEDSGFWNLHLYKCRNVLIEDLQITIPSAWRLSIRAPSTDGIDIDSSQHVTVRRCYISTHDDNIALKGTKGPRADQDPDSPPVENILIEEVECGEGNGLITCGSEATIVRNVIARQCTMSGRAPVLTLKLRPDTPQRYENITIDGVTLRGSGSLFNVAPWTQFFDLQGQPPPAREVNEITLKNIHGEYGGFGVLRGGERDIIRNVRLENIDVTLSSVQGRDRLALGQLQGLTAKNVRINGRLWTPAVADEQD